MLEQPEWTRTKTGRHYHFAHFTIKNTKSKRRLQEVNCQWRPHQTQKFIDVSIPAVCLVQGICGSWETPGVPSPFSDVHDPVAPWMSCRLWLGNLPIFWLFPPGRREGAGTVQSTEEISMQGVQLHSLSCFKNKSQGLLMVQQLRFPLLMQGVWVQSWSGS